MKTIEIKIPAHFSKIIIGAPLSNLKKYLPSQRCIIITDENILKYYRKELPEFPVISIGTGEKNKTLATLEQIFDKLVEMEADRTTCIIGIGGGIVCDVAGFAASVFMRGLRFGFVSTTLLSQVDASVGGKNGVNFRGFKNMLGVFNQPEFVICDPAMLMTLKGNEFRAGFSEIVKAGAIKSLKLFEYLETNAEKALKNDLDVIENLVYESVLIKSEVVEADEREKGERRKLNFGHTFAHAFENKTTVLHGEAVSMGMIVASELSHKLGYLSESDLSRIRNLLKCLQLPVIPVIDMETAFDAMKKDKKREGDSIYMILLKQIGEAVVQKFTYKQLEKLLYDLRLYN
jgi:3-dehydroquinate synthase